MAAPSYDNTAGTLIVENEALRKGFTIIPNYVLRNARLSFGARLTYTLLLSYAWQGGSCFPGQEKLAGDLQTDPRSIRRYLAELKAEGLIRVERRGLGLTNVYILTDVRPSAEADRTGLSALDRTAVSDQDRTRVSYKEDSDETDAARLNTGNRLAVEQVSEGENAGFGRVAELLRRRAPPAGGRQLAEKKLEVTPLAEEAARRLNASASLAMFYKVLLQLYPKHLYLFERAVKEAAEEPKVRVTRSALFAHIVRRLAREEGVPLSLGGERTARSELARDAGGPGGEEADSSSQVTRTQNRLGRSPTGRESGAEDEETSTGE